MPIDPVKAGTVIIDNKEYLVDRAALGVTKQELGKFETPLTTGDTTYKSDPYVSSWIVSDLSGGIGVEDITGGDTNRYRWGTADVRSPGNFTLGPLITATRPTTDDTDVLYCTGDVPGTNEEFYVAVEESAGLCNLYAWNEASDVWRAASLDIDSRPLAEPVRFKGTAANEYLVFARDAHDLMGVRTTGAGTLASVTGLVDAQRVAVWDNKLWAITDSAQQVSYSYEIATWTAVTDPATGSTLALDPAQPIDRMISWFNLAGESALFFATRYSLWAFNGLEEKFEHIYDFPRHTPRYDVATAGTEITNRPLAVWRPTEDLWIGAGGTVMKRTPAGVSVPLVGPGADADGLPAAFIGIPIDMEPEFNGLYLILSGFLNLSKAALLVYTGTGWISLWEAPNDDYRPTRIMISNASGAYRLWWGHGSYAYTMELHQGVWSPRQGYTAGTDKFAAASYFETGRFWAQTHGSAKVAHRVEVFAENATTTETIEIKYQTDTVTSWTSLGTVTTGRNSTPAVAFTSLYFGTADADGARPGLAFNWIKFRVEFVRGGTTTLTPIMNALVLHFVKVRNNTPAFTIPLDFPEKLPDGRTADEAIHDLIDLVEADRFVSLKHGHHVFEAWVAGLSGPEGTGVSQKGKKIIQMIALREVS